MREIKFRGWNTLCNEMWDCDKLVLSGLYLATSGAGIIDVDDDRNKQHHIIPLQYTGLKDKNGKEIYEGDILSFDYGDFDEFKDWYKNPHYKVVYDSDYIICGKGVKQDLYLHGFRFKHTEVLGNIYETPKLL
jgi:uncharacterized phage protein (TIGR01671 family)